MFRKVLLGYDGSKRAKAALRCAAALAMDFNMELTALWVREPLPRYSDLPSEVVAAIETVNEHFKNICDEIKTIVKTHCLDIRCVARAGHPVRTIVRHANEGGYDLIVVGHGSHSGLWGRFAASSPVVKHSTSTRLWNGSNNHFPGGHTKIHADCVCPIFYNVSHRWEMNRFAGDWIIFNLRKSNNCKKRCANSSVN